MNKDQDIQYHITLHNVFVSGSKFDKSDLQPNIQALLGCTIYNAVSDIFCLCLKSEQKKKVEKSYDLKLVEKTSVNLHD